MSAIDGATTPSQEGAYPVTPGEFAADWNSWDERVRTAYAEGWQGALDAFVRELDAKEEVRP
ncbi:hypothetical protein [Cellulomonas rhizosphaerae]|uniref:Uncharacterized protein n=1 Tax=Cellulomonas rhizosphaerae TaxID=2293719 RepID=A0A413RJF7_9CELL|nr:hypothetical protein [Cellulomonas rhizosphaerae]RHA38707.1 hypothetical protein D1825_13315 [Cellulomonas rhizosphaerae]